MSIVEGANLSYLVTTNKNSVIANSLERTEWRFEVPKLFIGIADNLKLLDRSCLNYFFLEVT